MKNLLVILFVLLISAQKTFSQSSSYQQAVEKSVQKLDTATRRSTFVELTNTFERIATKEKEEWLPYYYAAYTQVNQAYAEEDIDKIDPLCDKATWFAEQAANLSPNNAEIYCVKAMIETARIRVDFMERGIKQVTKSNELLKKAINTDQSNPRAYLLLGKNIAGTPEGFGGGFANAKKLFDKAHTVFKDQPTPTSSIEPHWGRESLEKIMQKYATSQIVK